MFPRGKKFSSKATKSPPSRPHQSMLPSNMDSTGYIMNSSEQAQKKKKGGMCEKCGIVKTHAISMRVVRRPLTVDKKVYKGYCLSCYSLTQAKISLNEPVDALSDLHQQQNHDHDHMTASVVTANVVTANVVSATHSNSNRSGVGSNNMNEEDHEGRYNGRERQQYEGTGSQGREGFSPSPGGNYQGNNVALPGGEYFEASRHHSHPEIPEFLDTDDMSVMSGISMDPSLMTTARHADHETGLDNIEEEGAQGSNAVSSSQDYDQGSNYVSSSDMNNSSFSDQRSHGSQSRPGVQAVKNEESNFNNLLRRKMDRNDNGRRASNASSEQKPPAAGNNNDHVRFREDTVPARGNVSRSAVRCLEGHILDGLTGDNAKLSHRRSNSEVNALSPPSSQAGHNRSATHGAATMPGSQQGGSAMARMMDDRIERKKRENDILTTKRSMSNEGSSVDISDTERTGSLHDIGSSQRSGAAPSNMPGVHTVIGSAADLSDGLTGDNDELSVRRSNSEGNALSPPSSQAEYNRSASHGADTMPGSQQGGSAMARMMDERIERKKRENDILTTKRSMSNEGSSVELDNIGSSQRSGAAPSNMPGVQSVSEKDNSASRSLMQRKIDRDNVLKCKKEHGNDHHGAMDDNMSISEARLLISDCSCCADLLEFLKKNSSSKQAVMLEALRKLRDCLLLAHFSAEDFKGSNSHFQSMSMDSLENSARSKIAFPNSGWTKVVMMIMSSNASNRIVLSELLHTLWTIVTLHPRYTSDLTSNPDMKEIIVTMETHVKDESIQEYGCGLLACIAATQKQAGNILRMGNGKFIKRLVSALFFHGKRGNVQENAFKALLRLSFAALPLPTDSFAHTMGKFAKDNISQVGDPPSVKAIASVLTAMEQNSKNASVQIYGNRLLWNIFTPDAIDDLYYVDLWVGKTLEHIGAAMKWHQDSQAFYETAICLLSKLSCYGSDSLGRETFLLAAVDAMRDYPQCGIVALHGCRTIGNVCARTSILSSSQGVAERVAVDGIPAILSCMEMFREHTNIQSEACAALCAVCISSPPNKEQVQQLGGVDRILAAFDSYSMNPYTGRCLTTKIRACVALTTLAVDPTVLSDIEDKGIISRFERLLTDDLNRIPDELGCAIQGLINMTLDDENTDNILDFLEGADEEETYECLCANLRDITSPDFASDRIRYLRSNAKRVMRNFVNSAGVHEMACKLLACAYAKASEEGGEHDDFDMDEELDAITNSLAHHKNNPVNASAASSALQNFGAMLSLSEGNLPLYFDAPDMKNLLSRSLQEVINDLVIHDADEENLTYAMGALHALIALREGLALTFEADGTIGSIVGVMSRYPNSEKLRRYGIGILGLFFMISDKIVNFFSDGLVSVIIRFIQDEVDNDDAIDLVDIAINIFLINSNKGFQAVTVLLRNERLIDIVVSCMMRYPIHPSIQSAGIDILSSVALDNHLRADVCQRGGTSRIIAALDNLRNDPNVVIKAYTALANLISGANPDILRACDTPAPRILVEGMLSHRASLGIQIGGAYALWALSARSDSFKDEIVNLGGAEAVSIAMNRFVGSKQMQTKGLDLIWSLAVPRHLKLRVGRCAVEPAVNGLSAHFTSVDINKKALGCLKCLMMIPVNKELLEENGAVELIYSCMWLHSGNSTVCKAALAALCNISVNVDTNEVSEITSDDLNAIVNTMRTHHSVLAVLESAIILLRNFTFSRTNILVLEQNEFLVPLVRSAMSNFNETFEGRADDLLRVLPALINQ